MSSKRSILPLALLGLAVAACATPTPPPPPSLTYANSACDAVPNLSNAISLTPEKEKAVHTVLYDVAATAPCLMRDGKAVPYVVFALPEDHEDKTLIAGSQLEINRIFAPQIETLGAQGATERAFERADYYYRGPVYSIQFRPRASERYLLVTAAPELVGVEYNAIQIGVNSSYMYTPYGGMTISSGAEAANSRTFAYNGAVSVMINDSEIDK